MVDKTGTWRQVGTPQEEEIRLLREALVRYGDRIRMAMSHSMEMQQVIDRAFEKAEPVETSIVDEYLSSLNENPSEETRSLNLADAFDMGYSWAMALRGQTLEDSRAIGRTLTSEMFDPIHEEIRRELDARGFDSFQGPDHGIYAAKSIIMAALQAGSPSTTVNPDGWLSPYRTMDESGDKHTAGSVGWEWISRLAEEAKAIHPERLYIETPNRDGPTALTLLYRGTQIIALTFVMRDALNWSVLMRWRAGAETLNQSLA